MPANKTLNPINILLLGMDQKKKAIFQMAFKMHTMNEYQIIDEGNEIPSIIIVDTDSPEGLQEWARASQELATFPIIYNSITLPNFETYYLAKPVKIETLFPLLRAILKGEGEKFTPQQQELQTATEKTHHKAHSTPNQKIDEDEDSKFHVRKFKRTQQLAIQHIDFFDVHNGLLGTLIKTLKEVKTSSALLHQNKALLIIFPEKRKILLTSPPEKLKEICEDDSAQITIREVKDKQEWIDNADVSYQSCLWQFAIWSARGRLISETTPETLIKMRFWPNMTRMAYIPDSMRMSAFLTQSTVNLNILYKLIQADLNNILNFIAASYAIGSLETNVIEIPNNTNETLRFSKQKENNIKEDEFHIRRKYKSQSSGVLQKLMNKLSGK